VSGKTRPGLYLKAKAEGLRHRTGENAVAGS